MPQQLFDLGEGSTSAQRLCRREMPQPVRMDDAQPDPLGRRGDHLRHPGGTERTMRRHQPDEYGPVLRAGWTTAMEGRRDGCADIHGKRQPIEARALPVDRDLAEPPIEVVKAERRDFAGAKPHAGQRCQNGEIAEPNGCAPIAGGQQSLHVGRVHRFRKAGQPPPGDGWDRGDECRGDRAI